MESEQLIRLVKLKPALWNRQDKAHHNRYILEKHWNEVALELNQPRKAVRDKWKNLRDMFRKEFHKTRFKASGKDPLLQETESYWPHFNSLSFLKDQFAVKIPDGNIQGLADNQPTNEFTDEDSLIDDSNDTNIVPAESLEKEFISGRTSTTELPEVFKAINSIKRSAKQAMGDENMDADKKKLRVIDTESLTNNDKGTTRDDDEDFLFSMLPFMKELPLAEKLLCRIKMQEVLFNLLFRKSPMENKSFRTKPPPPYRDPFSLIGSTTSPILSTAKPANENSD